MKKYFAFVALLMVIVFLYTGKDSKQHDQSSTYTLFKVECKNTSIPSFTLNDNADPSEDEVNKLCACIWNTFVRWEKETAVKVTSGETNTISAVNMARFSAIFGKRIMECGGDTMAKGQDKQKAVKKKSEKTLKEKRAAKKAKKS
ncbi:MAG TPA: hypothetical protein EYG82_04290 [Sulfurovum sp.]|nr:hypothetical protein [Sulfurovum sp.]